jgi:hypothetical protein
MQAQVMEITHNRRAPRHQVEWSASATVGDLVIQGTVKDYSVMGLFFEPEIATNNNEFFKGPDVLDLLEDGDIVTVRESRGLVFESAVRWMGKSQANGCYGFGCEFENVYCKAA